MAAVVGLGIVAMTEVRSAEDHDLPEVVATLTEAFLEIGRASCRERV